MIYNLLAPHITTSSFANLFHYISFRSGLAILLSLTICFIIGPRLIKYLRKIQKQGQPIRDDGPETHKEKVGTPTMGGIMMIISIVATTLLLADLTNLYIWIVLFILISFGLIGFADDYAKVSKNNYKGISGRNKLITQLIISLVACSFVQYLSEPKYENLLVIPYAKELMINLGLFYLPFGMIVVSGASNAVNLTDGLDGLAAVPIAIAAGSFSIICYLVGNIVYADYLQLIYVSHIGELTVFCASIVGSCLGFLWYNAQPAEVFMGDTGSLAFGGVLGIISVISKHEIILSIIGGIFVLETLSVIIQVYYFKISGGKRIFKMAPLHHHFEKHGWKESKVVIRFWIMALIFALIGLSSLKLR